MGFPPDKRLEIIKREFPRGTTQQQIADMCEVSRKTISKDIKKWRESGGFEEWLQEEFLELHREVKGDDVKTAYKEISKLVARSMTQKSEAKVEAKTEHKVNVSFHQDMKDEPED